MKNYIFALFACVLALCSCSEEGVGLFDTSKHYLYIKAMEGQEKDSVFMSFKHHVNLDKYEVKFPVHLLGQKLDADKKFKLEIIDDETSARAEEYELNLEPVFHAGVWTDTIRFFVKKTPRLDNESVRLTFRLIPNENFLVADYMGVDTDPYFGKLRASFKASVTFNNRISQPGWWDEDMTARMLGEYSDIKYERFIEVTDGKGADLTDVSETERRILMKQFKEKLDSVTPDDPDYAHWCEADGTKIEIPYKG